MSISCKNIESNDKYRVIADEFYNDVGLSYFVSTFFNYY